MGKFYFLHEFTQLRSLTVVKVHTMYLYIRLYKYRLHPSLLWNYIYFIGCLRCSDLNIYCELYNLFFLFLNKILWSSLMFASNHSFFSGIYFITSTCILGTFTKLVEEWQHSFKNIFIICFHTIHIHSSDSVCSKKMPPLVCRTEDRTRGCLCKSQMC